MTCEAFHTPEEWKWWFKKTKYNGNYSFIYFEYNLMQIEKTLAAILIEQNKPLKVDTIEMPNRLEIGQVLVKLHYSGIFHRLVKLQA